MVVEEGGRALRPQDHDGHVFQVCGARQGRSSGACGTGVFSSCPLHPPPRAEGAQIWVSEPQLCPPSENTGRHWKPPRTNHEDVLSVCP